MVTASSDISWRGPACTFNLRVAAITIRDGYILLCTVDGLGYWFLPGGRVQLGEPSDVALTRELAEELGHVLPGGTLALIVENLYRERSPQHEIGLCYRLAWPAELPPMTCTAAPSPVTTSAGCRPASSAPSASSPAGLIPVLPGLAGNPRHVVLGPPDR